MPEVFDVIVVGAGPAGEVVAGRVAAAGLSTVIVERELAGGECSYWACMPSKALLRPVDLAGEVSRVQGLRLDGPIDAGAVLAHRDTVVSNYDDSGQARWLDSAKVTLVRGAGRLTGARSVEVATADGGTRTLTANHAVVLATGSVPVIPPVAGLAAAQPWTNREVTAAHAAPDRLVVIGGGVVACEMAQAMRGLGSREVTMLVRGGGLLDRVEPFAGEAVARSLTEQGVDVRLRESAEKVERPEPGGAVTVRLTSGDTITADEILVATGRRPAIGDLGLASVGLPESRPVGVDDSMRATGVADGWLYAVGDVNGMAPLTHMGKYQARIASDVIVARARGEADDRPSMRDRADGLGAPQVIFTDPQVCAVGRTEAQARAEGFDVRAVEYEMGQVAGGYLLGDGYGGRAKAVVDESRRVLLGVTFVAPGAAELLHAATVAVAAGVTLDDLWHAVPSYPTVSEVWLRLLEEYGL
ncbi:NAD(P)/FAD-dependent oxidoreductase [Microbispora triticiradicis]|uniref:NAD(P)/FAD-dependent oxidoreductase n=1 Tax=Microbispora triticiradicis TaxID=2200763 RepID=A0ABX9LRM7_9ACTN|nr:NAD(P)/FAD-dependent oxidoreductase [Microbispora triticiradicis]RGA06560.1 NAD(P)/FAD-dependent oxidoreductase [Microbispora triticiradicis]